MFFFSLFMNKKLIFDIISIIYLLFTLIGFIVFILGLMNLGSVLKSDAGSEVKMSLINSFQNLSFSTIKYSLIFAIFYSIFLVILIFLYQKKTL